MKKPSALKAATNTVPLGDKKSKKVEAVVKKSKKNDVRIVTSKQASQKAKIAVKIIPTHKTAKKEMTKEKINKKGTKTENGSISEIVEVKEQLPAEVKPSVADATILQAVAALATIEQQAAEKKKKLFEGEVPLLMQIDIIKIPKCPKRKLRFKLPHWLVTDTSDICIFVGDLKRGKNVDHEDTLQQYEDMFREKGITNIKTIMPVRQVRVEFDQLEMRRQLLSRYEFFLTDARVSGFLSHKLGQVFFKKNMLPTPVKMDAKDLKAEIDRALHKTVLRLHGEGTTFTVKVSSGNLSPQQVVENVQAVLLQLSQQFPGGWENIRSVNLKTPLSMSVPIYLTLKNKNSVKQCVVQPLARRADDAVEGELSTIMDGRVKVYPDGRVVVIRKQPGGGTEETSDFELEDDEDDTSDVNNDDEEEVPKKKQKLSQNDNETKKNKIQESDDDDSEEDGDDKSDDEDEVPKKKQKLSTNNKTQKNKKQESDDENSQEDDDDDDDDESDDDTDAQKKEIKDDESEDEDDDDEDEDDDESDDEDEDDNE